MPLFFIVAGFLWSEKYSIVQKAKRRFFQLMVPYYLWGFIYLAINFVYHSFDLQTLCTNVKALIIFPTEMKSMPLAPPLWFLPCMFLSDNLFNMIMLKTKKNLQAVLIITIVAIGLIYENTKMPMLPFSIEPVLTGIGFMYLGYLIKKFGAKFHITGNKSVETLLMLIVAAALAFMQGSVDMRSSRYHFGLLFMLNGLLGTVAYWNLSGLISEKSYLVAKFLSYFGRNSLAFLIFNYPVMSFLWKINILPIENKAVLVIVVYIITVLVCSAADITLKKLNLKWVVGN